MRTATLILASTLCSLASVAAQTPDRTVRVFVLAGQSNMEGADTSASEAEALPGWAGVTKPRKDIRYRYALGPPDSGNRSDGWEPLQPDRRGRLGPELTFGAAVTAASRAPVAIVKSAWGGTTLARDWSPDEPSEKQLFQRTMTLVRDALADLERRRVPHRIEAVLWHQGENDMLDRALLPGYGERLSRFVASVREELDAPELAFFVGEISDKGIWGLDHRRNMQELRAQQRAVADADPSVHFVPTSHLAFAVMGSGQPHYHFGTEGQLHHGQAYARAYLESIGIEPAGGVEPFGEDLPWRTGATVRVFVLAGQRSAEGDGCHVASLPRSSHAALAQRDVAFRFRLGGGAHVSSDWVPLGPAGYLGVFGPELGLGGELDRLLDEPVAIVKVTDSAAALADWLPDPTDASRPQCDAAVDFVRDALTDLTARGYSPRLDAVFWIPGEHDAWWSPFRRRYAEDLALLIAHFRSELRAPELRWLVAELPDRSRWGAERLDEFDAGIAHVAEADPHVSFVETDEIETPDACVTFGPDGTVALGRLLARRFVGR